MDNDEKKQLALSYLQDNPLDYTGAAELLGVSFIDFMEFRGLYLKEFQEVEDKIFNLLEHLCMMTALGQPLPAQYADFDFQKARWILGCRRGWSVANKMVRVPTVAPEPTGEGKRLVDEYFSKGKLGDNDGSRIEILSETKRRDMQ